jgi:glycosyltransferase involved in cell wall biosynthesis
MRIAIILPAHNEASFIIKTLESLVQQSLKPTRIIVVNDNSNDLTAQLVKEFAASYDYINLYNHKSSVANIPGSKVVQAFNAGLNTLEINNYNLICKFDADLIFPLDYLEQITAVFNHNPKAGIVAGHCTVAQDGSWVLEKLTNKDHVRGALKAYRTACFEQIGGLKISIGWDTVDEMLARYHNWEVVTIPRLHVKHLKPTGVSYNPSARYLQGEAFYKMRYGWLLTTITATKMAWNKRDINLVPDYLKGYKLAQKKNLEPLVTASQGRFIRAYRWNGIKAKLFY